MNVVYSSSDSYSMVAGISMYSLLENNQSVDELNIFLIENGMSQENKDKFTTMCQKFNRQITFIPISDNEQLTNSSINIGRWNISTFARLFYSSMLPEWVDKVIHIDCDTMIMSSLEPLWNIDMKDKIVAGAYECIGDSYKTEVGMKPDDIYISAGNIMLNLAEIRRRKLEENFKKFIQNHRHLSFVDQPVLNACTTNEDKLLIPLNYNAYSIVFYLNYKNAKKAKRVSRYYTESQVLDAVSNPCIVHFTTCFMDGTRPWIENNNHPMIKQYLDYKQKSEWADTPLWKDNRSVVKKLGGKMFNILPQGFVAGSIGIVHDKILPALHKIKK